MRVDIPTDTVVTAAVFGNVVQALQYILPPPSTGRKKLWTVGLPLLAVISQNTEVFIGTPVLGFCRNRSKLFKYSRTPFIRTLVIRTLVIRTLVIRTLVIRTLVIRIGLVHE
jgi:hypothetical protein